MSKIDRYICFLIFIFLFLGCEKSDTLNSVPIIFDTDMGPDYDDAGAITILHEMAQNNEIQILATVGSNKFKNTPKVLSLFNTYWGQPDIPIGTPKDDAPNMSDPQKWTDTILEKYEYQIQINEQIPDAIDVYRKVLSKQPDKSVIIVTVGFLTNLAGLLQSEPDKYSALDGKQLVEKKVKKLVSMAGTFPTGREFNVFTDAASAKYTFESWPTEILFSGFEIGVDIKTGLPLIQNESITDNPVKDAYRISIALSDYDSLGRSSWDLTAVLVAIKGTNSWFSLKSGKIQIDEDGNNTWDEKGEGHYYIELKEDQRQALTDTLNELMQKEPLR